MPAQVFIRDKDCGTDSGGTDKKCIYVDMPLVKVVKGDIIKFHNQLDSTTPATLQFFSAYSKGTVPFPGFCEDESGSEFVVPDPGDTTGKKFRDCKTQFDPGEYAYTIEAEDHWEMDPIIIINPTAISTTALAVAALAVVVTGVVAFWLGSKQGRHPG